MGPISALESSALLDAEEVIAYLWDKFVEAHRYCGIERSTLPAARRMRYGPGAEFVEFYVISQEQRDIQANYAADLALAGVREIVVIENVKGREDFWEDDYAPEIEHGEGED